MYRSSRAVLLLLCVFSLLAINVFGQTGSQQVSGFVQDTSKGLIPGVTITLTNSATGVTATQLTNESGVYSFQGIPPGTYSLSASLPGFKTSVTNGVQVSQATVRVNITLEVGTLDSKVEVSVGADTLLTENAASVGTVLPQQKVTDLPLVGQNVLSLLTVLPGFRADPVADRNSTIGGLNLDYTNTTINGLSTVSSRDSASFWGRQVLTTNVINPDLVGEIRLILSPVDAELGRGNSQIQIQTRSGTNKYTGSAVWNVQNTALNANTWANKRNPGPPTQADWYNLNQITGTYGGPIIRNKTFFFVLYDKQMVNRRQLVVTPVLTDSARQGIWRYWEGWNPGPALQPEPTSFVTGTQQPTGTAASVDFSGNPIAPTFNPTGGPYTLGGLKCFSLFGDMKVGASGLVPVDPSADCPGGTFVTHSGAWDTFRTTFDSTGYIRNILSQMPKANYFAAFGTPLVTPDGLNTGLYRWVQGRKGPSAGGATNAALGVVNGAGDYNNRDQINVKIDHNLSSKHRLSVSWTYEVDNGDAQNATWGTGLNGNSARHPQFVTVNGTSTLSPTLVNEARFGLNYSSEFASSPWTNYSHTNIRDDAQKYILYGGTNATNGRPYPVLYNPGANWNGYMAFNSFDFANYSPLYDFADTVRWTHAKHAFSVGGEYRRPSTVGYNGSAYIQVNPGNGGGTSTPLFFSNTNLTNAAASLPNFLATTRGNAGTLLSTFYGAINAPNTAFWIDGQQDVKSGQWQDVTTIKDRFKSNDPYGHQTRGEILTEWSFFLKDDYKLNKRLTLNLGVRWDRTGSPYLTKGLTNTLDREGFGLFGAGSPADKPFDTWLSPGNLYLTGYGSNPSTAALQCANGVTNPNGLPTSNCDPNRMSTVIFVGPGTDHPDKTLTPQKGAFSPALGFSWVLPWFGEGKTTVRGGFQRTYGKPGSPYTGGLLSGPGADGTTSGVNTSDPRLTPILATRALNLTDLALVVPATPSRPPQDKVYPVGARSGALSNYALFDPNFRNPHSDNWTLTIQRTVTNKLTVEVRAVNTLARDQAGTGGVFGTPGSFDINTINVYHNPELFNALENTRKGLDDPLFDQMLMGMNLNVGVPGYGAVGTCVTQAAGSTDPRLGVGCPNSNQILQRGSAQLRRAFGTLPNNQPGLANGNYVGVLNSLLGAGSTGAGGLQALPIDPATGVSIVTSQRPLRNGCDRIANGLTTSFVDPNSGQTITSRCFPENYIVTNPQWSSALYSTNLGYSDYNSVEVQFTLRPTHGLSLQSTYGFSKTMIQPGNGFTDPKDPTADYGMSLQSVGQDFRTNGTFELPIGPNKLLFANSTGWLARAIERWQMGFIYSISSGSPRTFNTGNNMLYANGRPNIVGPWDNPKGSVRWNGQNGYFFDDTYATYQDPQCQSVTALDGLQANCSLRGLALVVPSGTAGAIPLSGGTFGVPLLENPTPGHQGNLGSATLNTFALWNFDANLSKTFQISESKSLQVRVDATNVFNHPTPADAQGNPYPTGLGTGSSFNDNFGQITNKVGSRTFQAKLRFTF